MSEICAKTPSKYEQTFGNSKMIPVPKRGKNVSFFLMGMCKGQNFVFETLVGLKLPAERVF